MNFDPNKIYYTCISTPTFSNLPIQEMKSIIMDGRYASPFMERFVQYKFDNIEKLDSDSKGKDYIYKDGSKKPLEMRGFPCKAKDIKLYPSYMIGAGRSYNEEEFLDNQKKISGHIIVYQYDWLDYIIFHLSSEKVVNDNNPIKTLKRKDVGIYLGIDPSTIVKKMNTDSLQRDHLYEVEIV